MDMILLEFTQCCGMAAAILKVKLPFRSLGLGESCEFADATYRIKSDSIFDLIRVGNIGTHL